MICSKGTGAATAAGVPNVTGTGLPTDDCNGVPGPVIVGGCIGVTDLAPLSP